MSTVCKFGAKCFRKDCYFAHPERVAKEEKPAQKKVADCKYGAKCFRKDCYFVHPAKEEEKKEEEKVVAAVVPPVATTPAQKKVADCKYGVKCFRKDCYFSHSYVKGEDWMCGVNKYIKVEEEVYHCGRPHCSLDHPILMRDLDDRDVSPAEKESDASMMLDLEDGD
jgi:hypothetical protein